MHYTRIHRSNNHQIFLNGNGEVVIADQSGTTPDQTDDGPLIVEPNAEVLVCHSPDYGLLFNVTVLIGRDGCDQGSVWMVLKDFRALHRQLPGLRVKATPDFLEAHRLLQEAWLMAKSAEGNETKGETK